MTDTPAATGETYFFRDRGQFDLLRFRLLPELIGRRREAKILRLWSAGCASGEEAYSLAMLVDMLLPEREEWDILILGTDIDPAALEKARRGRYGQWSFRLVSAGLQRRYFRREGEEWELDEGIREMARFRALDLIGGDFPDAELRDMDLILCRNVFIYFRPEEVERVAAKMAAALSEGGYLMTGHTELMGHTVAGLTSRLFPEGVVYQGAVSAGRPSPPAPLPLPQGASPPGSRCFAATTARQGGRVEKAPPSSWGRGCGEGTPGIPAAPPSSRPANSPTGANMRKRRRPAAKTWRPIRWTHSLISSWRSLPRSGEISGRRGSCWRRPSISIREASPPAWSWRPFTSGPGS